MEFSILLLLGSAKVATELGKNVDRSKIYVYLGAAVNLWNTTPSMDRQLNHSYYGLRRTYENECGDYLKSLLRYKNPDEQLRLS